MLDKWLLGEQPISPEDLEQLEKQQREIEDRARDLAVKIATLVEYPEWKAFMEEIDRMEPMFKGLPTYYAEQPNRAHYDSGALRVISAIKSFIDTQLNIAKSYVEQKEQK